MKILFKSKNGKQLQKEFTSLNEAKEFTLKNKKVISEAQIMEGPLGSGQHPSFGKWWNRAKKGMHKMGQLRDMLFGQLDANDPNSNVLIYLTDIANSVLAPIYGSENFWYVLYGGDGLFLLYKNADKSATKKLFDKNGYNYDSRGIFTTSKHYDSEKYGKKVYLPKLTKYMLDNDALPSEEQLRKYFKDVAIKRISIAVKRHNDKFRNNM